MLFYFLKSYSLKADVYKCIMISHEWILKGLWSSLRIASSLLQNVMVHNNINKTE